MQGFFLIANYHKVNMHIELEPGLSTEPKHVTAAVSLTREHN